MVCKNFGHVLVAALTALGLRFGMTISSTIICIYQGSTRPSFCFRLIPFMDLSFMDLENQCQAMSTSLGNNQASS